MHPLQALRDAGTAVVSDVFDDLGRRPPVLHHAITPLRSGIAFAGPAYTIAGRSEDFDGGDRPKLRAIDEMPDGCVAVWAGTDIRGVCCFGDLLATSMQARGVAGVVVDGGVRDASFLSGMDLPVLARFRTPAQGIGRWKVTAVQEPVRLRGGIDDEVLVSPGDVVVGDDDGIVVVPTDLVDEVAARAAAWAEGEDEARDAIADGLPLLAALERFGHL